MVERTAALASFERKRLGRAAARIVEQFDEDALRRAVSYLYTKETRSSFGIEGEKPSASRTERFVALLHLAARLERFGERELVQMQNDTVDARFADRGYRQEQVYVGEQLALTRQQIHFIAPRPEDVPELMAGWLACVERLRHSDLDPVVQAAVASFGFVFIHPFSDGNGRLHRLLIHHVLARAGFTPPGLIFPVSAVMLQRRLEYDAALESFSRPLMPLIDYEELDDGAIAVKNETADFYRYFDATLLAESLYRWTEQTVTSELREELDFIVKFRQARRQMEEVVELPDRSANLFVRLALHNQGRIGAAKRKRFFAALTDDEVRRLERIVRSQLLEASRRRPAEPSP